MQLIVGLGNPGKKYEHTRHNVGFMVADKIANNFKLVKKYNALISKTDDIIIAKPQTFMNNSGLAVSKITDYYKINLQDIYIIYDDKDLPFGKIRIRKTGSAGGHNGVKSIIQHLGSENFNRIRIGVKNNYIKDTSDFVMSNFSTVEKKQLKNILIATIEGIETAIIQNIDVAMNKFN